jgi:hypothetical protein
MNRIAYYVDRERHLHRPPKMSCIKARKYKDGDERWNVDRKEYLIPPRYAGAGLYAFLNKVGLVDKHDGRNRVACSGSSAIDPPLPIRQPPGRDKGDGRDQKKQRKTEKHPSKILAHSVTSTGDIDQDDERASRSWELEDLRDEKGAF